MLLQVETDKVTIDVRYTQGEPGVLKEYLVAADDTVAVNQEVAVIETGGEAPDGPAETEARPAEDAPKQDSKPAEVASAPPPPPPPPQQQQQQQQPKAEKKAEAPKQAPAKPKPAAPAAPPSPGQASSAQHLCTSVVCSPGCNLQLHKALLCCSLPGFVSHLEARVLSGGRCACRTRG